MDGDYVGLPNLHDIYNISTMRDDAVELFSKNKKLIKKVLGSNKNRVLRNKPTSLFFTIHCSETVKYYPLELIGKPVWGVHLRVYIAQLSMS